MKLSGMVVAVDFDGTIAKWARFPSIGEPVPHALETLREMIANDVKIVLNTVRCSEALELACEWLKGHGIKLHGVNARPGQIEYSLSPKIDAELYIDDKAFGCPVLSDDDGRLFVDWLVVRKSLGM